MKLRSSGEVENFAISKHSPSLVFNVAHNLVKMDGTISSKALSTLNSVFSYDSFKSDLQQKATEAVLKGRSK